MKTVINSRIIVLVFLAFLAPLASSAAPAAAAPGAVHISLERSGCRGSCPAYRIDIHDDGSLLYEGFHHVSMRGKKRYALPPEEVSKLVRSAVSKNLMSLKDRYEWIATDLPTFTVKLTLGGRTHQIIDYAGQQVGMPAAVSQFEQEIDDTLERAIQRSLSPQALAQLAAEGFLFNTPAGIDLLERAVDASSASDDKDRLAIFERLAPAAMSGKQRARAEKLQHAMVGTAIAQGNAALLTHMLSRGALRTAGKYDQTKIDQAFFTAVASSRPALVEMLWQLPDKAPHPALQYDDVPYAPAKGVKRVPLTLILGNDTSRPKDGSDFAIARFLVEKGCNPRVIGAKKQTLLHIATESNDVHFVRYVLGLGADPSVQGQFGPALASAQNEDVAMALLEAGMSSTAIDKVVGFRQYSQEKKWHRVLAWLTAHGR